ncbi:hypothetical protein BGX28_009772 [Mortierella sp. GBA30]|nr:hypothetical protein BGX28_009772 [Mortierella sp. GBA30]
MNASLQSNNLTLVAFPPLVALLTEVQSNISKAGNNLTALTSIVGSASSAVGSITQVFLDTEPLLKAYSAIIFGLSNVSDGTLLLLVQGISNCSGTTASDCVGALDLYHSYADSAQARTKVLGVGAKAAIMTQVSTDLRSVTAYIDYVLATGNVSILAAAGSELNRIIGYTTGNVQMYGNISDSVTLVYESAKEVLRCQGFNTTLFANKCSVYTDRLNGVLVDFIQFLQGNIGQIPVIGTLILNPLLGTLQALLTDLQNGVATAVGGVVSMLSATLKLVNIVTPAAETNDIRDYILRLLGIINVPGECGGLTNPCNGLFMIVHLITDATLNLVGAIPLLGFLVKGTLAPVLNGLLSALQSGAAGTIQSALGLVSSALGVVSIVPGMGTITSVLKILIDAAKSLVDCMVVHL